MIAKYLLSVVKRQLRASAADRAKRDAKRKMLPNGAPGQVPKSVPGKGVLSLITIWYLAIARADAKHSC
jgi:hypothetical protein